MNNQTHHSKSWQDDWNKYGKDAFIFEVIECCDENPESLRLNLEQKYLDELRPYIDDIGYNSNKKATGGNGTYGENRFNAVITEEIALNIINELQDINNKIKDIADRYNVSEQIVSSIGRKRTWTYLTENIVFPDRSSNKTYLRRDGRIKDNIMQRIIEYLLSGKSNAEIGRLTNIPVGTISGIRHHTLYNDVINGINFPVVHDKKINPKQSHCKLTENDVLEIYSLHDNGYNNRDISKLFDVGEGTIGNILKGHTWKKLFKEQKRIPYNVHKNRIMVRCINTGIVYKSIISASRDTGCSENSIKKICEGENIVTHNHYKFEYYIEDSGVIDN